MVAACNAVKLMILGLKCTNIVCKVLSHRVIWSIVLYWDPSYIIGSKSNRVKTENEF